MPTYTMPDGRLEKVAIYGTTTPSSSERTAYQAENDLTYAGTPDEVAAYIADLQAEIAAAPPPPPPEPPPIPQERQEIYTRALALLAEAEITEPPADWPAAVAAAEPYLDAATTNDDIKLRTKTLMKLLAIRDEIRDAGGSWEEALRFAADQQA